ncbi:MAG: ABC transporter permease [Lachnospiraceae bacterium]
MGYEISGKIWILLALWFLTVLYVVLLFAFPPSWKENAAAILIFSDPAAMGLFFMGAIVLFEKSQRVTSFLAVSPLRTLEYVGSKVFSLSLIALLVAAVLAVAANCESLFLVLFGTFLYSVLFTLLGIIIATKITSLNQFILAMMPVEIFAFVPAILHLFKITPAVIGIYPANVCMNLIASRAFSVGGLMFTVVLIALLFFVACRCSNPFWCAVS